MSRKDTIIVAALINAGLLIILFISALKNPSKEEYTSQNRGKNRSKEVETARLHEPKVVIGDEVDQILSQYAKQNLKESSSVVATATSEGQKNGSIFEEKVAAVEPLSASSQSFVDDLSALTKASNVTETQEKTLAAQPLHSELFAEVTVARGDVLEKIARAHHCSVQEIMRINKLSSSNLRIGQVLKVPSASASASAAQKVQNTPSAKETNSSMYTVKSGDNPWTIAVKNHMKVEDLLRLNNMDEAKARKLKPGDQIRIR